MYRNGDHFIQFKREKGSLFSQILAEIEKGQDYGLCSGRGACGNCRVRFTGYAPLPSAADRRFFTLKQLREGYRLACTAKPEMDCEVEVCFAAAKQAGIVTDHIFQQNISDGQNRADKQVDITQCERSFCVVDIGTTTVAMQLISAADGSRLATCVFQNPQRLYGTDVLARIQAANNGKRSVLQKVLLAELEKGMRTLERTGIPEIVFLSGNTTMAHLLLGYSVEQLGTAPFTPFHIAETYFVLGGHPAVFLPGISAFVGADIVSGIYACGMTETEELSLLIDLGTNGEMALGNKDGILCTATAAGSAFEGGVSAEALGTDVISFIYDMLERGILDETGLLAEPYFKKGYQENGIHIRQPDIRNLQMAKAAICAGAVFLIHKMNAWKQIEHVYLAGGFGYYLDVHRAVGIGLLPKGLEKKCQAVGNASLGGLIRYGMEYIKKGESIPLRTCKHIVELSKVINLAGEEEFEQKYIEFMSLQDID